jgi:hypothetical protein
MRTVGVILSLGLLVTVACRRPAEPPVARLVVDPAHLELTHGTMVPLELRWEILAPLGDEGPDDLRPLVFIHLVDEVEGLQRTFDQPFPGAWEPGRTVRQTVHLYHSAIAPAIAPGDYILRVGLYDGARRRWALAAEGGDRDRLHYHLATVRATVPSTPAPRYGFEGEWLPVEPGGDRQAVARRWLAGAGELELESVPAEGGRLWLMLVLPDAVEGTRLVLEKGEVPSVTITSDCGGFEAHLVGAGPREVSIPIPAGSDRCTVSLAPGHYLVELETLRRLAVAVDQLAWQEGAPEG